VKKISREEAIMIEKIIVPLDGSQTAEVALPYAEEIAGRMGCDMIIIYVREPKDNQSPYMLQCYLERVAEKAKSGAEKYLGESGLKEIKVEAKILTGSPAEEIVNFADRTEGAKIIMATHGQSGIGRWALGSVADKVTRATIRPVAVIRAKGAEPDVHPKGILHKILVPLDGSKESEVVLPYVVEMATKLKAEVTLLRVLSMGYISPGTGHLEMLESMRKEARDYLNKISDFLKAKGVKSDIQILEAIGDEAMEIVKYTRENYVDTTIMATHGRSGPRRWVLGSVTNKVLREGDTPLMLVRTPGVFTD
jgi:nucleotide-binding universal stress UspA family protein